MEASQGPRMKFMHQQRQSIDSDEKSGVMILKITTALTLNLHLNANESKSQGMPESKPQSPRPLGVAHAKRMRYICNFTLKEYECSQRHFADCAEMAQTFVQSILLHITTPFASDGQRTRHAVNNAEHPLLNRGTPLMNSGAPLATECRPLLVNSRRSSQPAAAAGVHSCKLPLTMHLDF